MFVSNSFGGSIQQMDLSADDFNLIALVTRELRSYIDNMENARCAKNLDVHSGKTGLNAVCTDQSGTNLTQMHLSPVNE